MRRRNQHLSAFSYCLPTRSCVCPQVVAPSHVCSYSVGGLATQCWSCQSQLPPTHFTPLPDFLGGDCPLMLSIRTAGRAIDGWTLNKAWMALSRTNDSSFFTCHNGKFLSCNLRTGSCNCILSSGYNQWWNQNIFQCAESLHSSPGSQSVNI